jgi:uncharacterized membrane protein YeaQ/YmgE (transglycosylase-associated protein family)
MGAPLIGMAFTSFLVLLIVSAIAAVALHWVFRYRLLDRIDGFLGQWLVAWLGAWLGPAVLGHWFDSAIVSDIYILPAIIGAFAGAFAGTLNAKLLAHVASKK